MRASGLAEQIFQVGEGRMCCARHAASRTIAGIISAGFKLALVFVVMAVQAEQFPVAAIHRIVLVIVVTVMNRQFAQIGAGEFACATAADPGVYLQGLFAVALVALFGAISSIGDDAIQTAGGISHAAIFPAGCCSCAGRGCDFRPCSSRTPDGHRPRARRGPAWSPRCS